MTAVLTLPVAVTTLLGCAAGCGTPLHPAAAAGGHDRHPGCEPTGPSTVDAWHCVRCGHTGTALGAAHGVAMSRIHDIYACPMTAGDEEELLKRIGRQAGLSRLYPDRVPPVVAVRTPGGRLVARPATTTPRRIR